MRVFYVSLLRLHGSLMTYCKMRQRNKDTDYGLEIWSYADCIERRTLAIYFVEMNFKASCFGLGE
jgi:hypothetical protein